MIGACAILPEHRKIAQVEVDIMRNEEIDEAIVVVIAEGQSRGPALVAVETGFFRHVGKRTVMVVAVEDYAAEATDSHVGPTIIVEITHCNTHSPAGIADAGLVGHVGEGAIV